MRILRKYRNTRGPRSHKEWWFAHLLISSLLCAVAVGGISTKGTYDALSWIGFLIGVGGLYILLTDTINRRNRLRDQIRELGGEPKE